MSAALFSFSLTLVAPHAGAWIEITKQHASSTRETVAPHAGAWIEILQCL